MEHKAALLGCDFNRQKVLRYTPASVVCIRFFVSSFTQNNWFNSITTGWSHVTFAETLQHRISIPLEIICNADIILISSKLDGISGKDVAEMVHGQCYPGIVACVAQGENPENYFKHFFGRFEEIKSNMYAANQFIDWLNTLIKEVEQDHFPIMPFK